MLLLFITRHFNFAAKQLYFYELKQHVTKHLKKYFHGGKNEKIISYKNRSKFDIYLNEIFSVAGAKIKSLGIIRNRLNLSHGKVLYSFFIPSQSTIAPWSGHFKVKYSKTRLTKLKKER